MGAVNIWQQSNMKSVLAAFVITLAAVQGQHVHNIEWTIKTFEECISPGEVISFNWNGKAHNVVEVNAAGYEKCETGATDKAGAEGPFEFTARTTGTHYFVCGVGEHCKF